MSKEKGGVGDRNLRGNYDRPIVFYHDLSGMNLLLSFISEYFCLLVDAVAEATKWWRDNDMGGAEHRSIVVDSAPKVFVDDGMPVMIDATDSFRFGYDSRGYFLEQRESNAVIILTESSLRRYGWRGLKGLGREAARLRRVKPTKLKKSSFSIYDRS